MAKFLLTDWEINGYNDSDFMCSYFDDVTNTIGFKEYGTTRFPSPTMISISGGITSVVVDGENLLMPDAEMVEKARLALEENIFQRLTDLDKRLVDEPGVEDLQAGLHIRLKEKARMQVRESSVCNKCVGSGKWTNPRNPNDKRDCFACKGSGQHIGTKLKDENGKQVYKELLAGLPGEVVEWGSFGKFYANGYNKPNRENTTVQFRTSDGEVVRASLSKMELARDYLSSQAVREMAHKQSFNYGFSALYPRFAWDTSNYAAQVAKAAAPIHAA